MTGLESNRGVWNAPWTGPNGELVLIALESRGRLIDGPVAVPRGVDHVTVADTLWELLDTVDPLAMVRLGSAPRFGRLKDLRKAELRLEH